VNQDDRYEEASAIHGRALERLVCAYEADPDKRGDLLQEIHIALWRSFKRFEDRCSLRTWVYCIAHNTATSYITRQRRDNLQNLVSLEQLDSVPDRSGHPEDTDTRLDAERLLKLVHRLKPVDRQLMLLYLEDLDAVSIGEIMGISTNNVRIQIYRLKKVLSHRFQGGSQ
jgi:RNA polymerase sigma-70 factor (ECF subfamily)